MAGVSVAAGAEARDAQSLVTVLQRDQVEGHDSHQMNCGEFLKLFIEVNDLGSSQGFELQEQFEGL
jgi:hypothetical protein